MKGRIVGLVVLGVTHRLTPAGDPVEPAFNPRAQRRQSAFGPRPAPPRLTPPTVEPAHPPPPDPPAIDAPHRPSLFEEPPLFEDSWPDFDDRTSQMVHDSRAWVNQPLRSAFLFVFLEGGSHSCLVPSSAEAGAVVEFVPRSDPG
jgi:hypothetical protein